MKNNELLPAGLGESWLIMIGILLIAGAAVTAEPPLLSIGCFPMPYHWITRRVGHSRTLCNPFIVVIIYVTLRASGKYKEAAWKGTPPYANPPARIGQVPLIFYILLLPILIVSMSVILDPVTDWLEMPEFMKKMFEQMTETNVPTFIAVVVAAPLLEEWLLRSVALKGMLQHMAPWKAIVWSAVMFGVIHGNPWQAIPAFLMGCLFGWIYYRTRSYWTCVALHAINNGMSFLLVALLPQIATDTSLRQLVGNQSFFITFGLSVATLGLSLFYLYKNLAPAPDLELSDEYQQPISPGL